MTPLQSDGVRSARVLCIFWMSYVHLHFFKLPGAEFPVTQTILQDTFGRSSVPLLSVLSGYFMVGYFAKRSYVTAAKARARSLLVPMVIWNSVACLLLGFEGRWWNDIFAATDSSRLVYLTFLRDLFVMSLLTPILVYSVKRAKVAFCAVAFAYYISGWSNFVVLRPQIAFFFGLGVVLALHPQPLPRHANASAVLAMTALILIQVVFPESSGFYFDNLLLRPVTALSFWVLALWVSENIPALKRLERAVFPFFLTHGIWFLLVGSAYSRLTMLHTVPMYYAAWLLTPALVLYAVHLLWPRMGKLGKAIA